MDVCGERLEYHELKGLEFTPLKYGPAGTRDRDRQASAARYFRGAASPWHSFHSLPGVSS